MATQTQTVVQELIREANEHDIPHIVELGRKFLLEGPYRDHLQDNPDEAYHLAMRLLQSTNAKIVIAEEQGEIMGVFAFAIFPYPYSGEIVAGELIWYVAPGHRIGGLGLKLLWEGERLARANGAKKMHLTMPFASQELAPLFERYGYTAVEIAFQGKL